MTLLVIRLTHSHPLPPLGYLQVTDPDLRSAPCLLPPTIIQHESCRSVLTTTALSSVCWYHPLAASVLFCHMHAIVHDKNRGGRASAVPLTTLQCCTTHLQTRCLQELLRSRWMSANLEFGRTEAGADDTRNLMNVQQEWLYPRLH